MSLYKSSDLQGAVLTVNGPIDPLQLGKTICHEHLFIDFRLVYKDPPVKKDLEKASEKVQLNNLGWIRNFWNSNKDNLLLNSYDDALEELNDFKKYGKSIVELTSMGSIRLNNHQNLIKSLSNATNINIIIGSGFYVDNSLPNFFKKSDEDNLSKLIINDFFSPKNNISSGVIGEIGCSFPLTKNEKKSLKASAIAQEKTGASIIIHPGRNEDSPFEIIEFLKKENANINRVVIGHIERTIYSIDKLNKLASENVFMNFDQLGIESSYYPLNNKSYMPNDYQKIKFIKHLIETGYSKKILLGHDIYSKHRLKKYGGHGYSYILEMIIMRMIAMGISQSDVNKMIIENPKKILTLL
tara:strand:+ start:1126 stop:2190 length:1065 start_codon:yes stop_codon:yes gene_type:complete